MSTADEYILNETMAPVSNSEPMRSKQMLYINDNNNSAYNGQILFDASSLSNSGKFINWREGVIVIPYVLSLKSSVSISATAYSGFAMGIKNGYYQLIDSLSVDLGNSNVVQQTPFTNFLVNYKVLTRWGANDLKKYGSTLGVAPDNALSYLYSTAGGLSGDGLCNNVVNPADTLTYATEMGTYNDGLLSRMQMTAFPLTSATSGSASLPLLTAASQAQAVGKSYFTDDGGSGAARIYSWNIIATIRLKDICDFFDKLPLLKNGSFRLTLNYNSAQGTITYTTGASMVNASQPTLLSGRTVPFMMASSAASNPNANWVTTTTITYAGGVKSTASPAASNAILSTCRLYVPAYDLQPADEKLIRESAERIIEYEDLYQYSISSVAAGASFNQIVSNGIVDPIELVVVPMINKIGNSTAVTTLDAFTSPFDSAPGTTCPYASISNYQVQLSGSNVYQSPIAYDWDNFLSEVSQSGAINGGQSTGLTSGLLGEKDWAAGYRYYVTNLARRIPANNMVPISVAISGTNNTSRSMDYIVFVSYRRKIALNVIDGSIRRVAQ